MAVKDRTNDFRQIAQIQQRNKSASGSTSATPSPAPAATPTYLSHSTSAASTTFAPKTQFAIHVSQTNKSLHDIRTKMNNLSKLARNRALFDPTVDFEKHTLIIKNDLTSLNSSIDSLNSHIVKSNEHTHKNSENIISLLQKQLAILTNDFRDILEIRSQNLKDQQKSKSEFTGFSTGLSDVSFSSYSDPSDQCGEISINMPEMQMVQEYQPKSRLESVQRIEGTIVELGEIFQQIRTLVVEQGEMIERIDADVDETSSHLDRSQNELLKYWTSLASSRSLTVKVFLVLIAFIFAFVVFFV